MVRGLAAALIPLLLQEDRAEQLWRFKSGSAWTYEVGEGAEKGRGVQTVTGEKGGRVLLELKKFKGDGTIPSQTIKQAHWFENGYVMWGYHETDGNYGITYRMWKVGARKGDRWKAVATEVQVDAEMEYRGPAEVKTAAGTYKQAHHVAALENGEAILELHLVEGVGLVKWVDKRGSFSMELTRFVPGN